MEFSQELGEQMHGLIRARGWKVCYEFRNPGKPETYQSMDAVYEQVAQELQTGPRYHVFPGALSYQIFIAGVIDDSIQVPRVTINNESRIVFGFGLQDDHCFFVTNTVVHLPSADREPKSYEFMLEALGTLEHFRS